MNFWGFTPDLFGELEAPLPRLLWRRTPRGSRRRSSSSPRSSASSSARSGPGSGSCRRGSAGSA
ncbi:MAG: hypothetical protein MZU95_07210 [Desulfomicrobium escambiense]|nr:hypothetical protein [Desulfomicrobium escambiense]